MGTTFITREPVGTAPIATQPNSTSVSPGPTSLAELLAEAGLAIDALPTTRLDAVSGQIAAITAHLMDGARAAGADGGEFTPSRTTPGLLSLRALGRLSTRTVGQDVPLDAVRADRIRGLIAAL
jgi:hypothetical protein